MLLRVVACLFIVGLNLENQFFSHCIFHIFKGLVCLLKFFLKVTDRMCV